MMMALMVRMMAGRGGPGGWYRLRRQQCRQGEQQQHKREETQAARWLLAQSATFLPMLVRQNPSSTSQRCP